MVELTGDWYTDPNGQHMAWQDYEKAYEEQEHNKQIKLIVGEYIDNNINSSNPVEEWCNGDVVILSKYDLGRMIILENFDIDDEHFNGVYFDRLYDLVEAYMNDIICEILDGAIEYCDNNDINYHM